MNRLVSLSLVLMLVVGCGPSEQEIKAKQEALKAQQALEAQLAAELKAKQEEEARAARLERYKSCVTQGKEALDAKRFAEAVRQLNEAVTLQDETLTRALLKQAEDGLQAERQAAYDAAMKRAISAQQAKNYTEAQAACQEALRIMSQDTTALRVLREVEYQIYFAQGRTALDQAQYLAAIKSLNEAIKRQPEDGAAQVLLQEAQVKRREQVMSLGKAALDKLDYTLAIQHFTEAKQWRNDVEVDKLFTEASFQKEKQEGRKLLESKQYVAAITRLQSALRLNADDSVTREMLSQAHEGKKLQDRADYERLVKTGEASMQRKNYAEALKAFKDARDKQPKDTAILVHIANAEKEKDKQDKYNQHMATAKSMMASKNYSGAEVAYNSALLIMAGDISAGLGLAEARTMKAKKIRYDGYMSSGNGYMASKNYTAAIAQFQLALFEFPGDSAASSAIGRARSANVPAPPNGSKPGVPFGVKKR